MSEISEGNKFYGIDLVLIQQGLKEARACMERRRLTDPGTGKLSVPDFEELIMNTGLKLY
jgi:hypothetical protein